MKRGYVSRIVWELAHGPIPDELCVLHTCDNPLCLRTSHLFLGTNTDNVNDRVAKGIERHTIGEDHHRAQITAEQVVEIRRRFEQGNIQKKVLASEYGLSYSAISHIIKRRTWKHVT